MQNNIKNAKYKTQNTNLALTGGYAIGEALRQINPDVMAVYPITPQTPIIASFSKHIANGKANTKMIEVESEHSAMSACIGASASGARTMTASSSQGIMYMMEVIPVAAAMRLPIVMTVANRAISGMINIHNDHSDAMAMRDFGWVQIFSETVQEAYDDTFIALRIAEKAKLPVAPNLDGFFITHSVENTQLLSDEVVRNLVGEYQPDNYLFDFANPITYGALALPDSYMDVRLELDKAMEAVPSIFKEVVDEFAEISGRQYDFIEKYKVDDAEKIVVAIGSTAGTIKDAIDNMREKGEKVGLVKIKLFRPFPYEEVREALKNAKEIIVMEKNLAIGARQVLENDIVQSVGSNEGVRSVVYGLGGKEIFVKEMEEIIK
jgi:pyruvate ferredoxin oxidoreductase alpha subunit